MTRRTVLSLTFLGLIVAQSIAYPFIFAIAYAWNEGAESLGVIGQIAYALLGIYNWVLVEYGLFSAFDELGNYGFLIIVFGEIVLFSALATGLVAFVLRKRFSAS